MKESLVKQLEDLLAKLDGIKDANPAAWKSARKIRSALEILNRDWPEEKPAAKK